MSDHWYDLIKLRDRRYSNYGKGRKIEPLVGDIVKSRLPSYQGFAKGYGFIITVNFTETEKRKYKPIFDPIDIEDLVRVFWLLKGTKTIYTPVNLILIKRGFEI